jgi:hypothetical protein
MQFKESDFIALEDFDLKWCWTDARWNKLPDDALEQIRPLTENKAQEIDDVSAKFFKQVGPGGPETNRIRSFNCSGDPSHARTWLKGLNINPSITVVWSYDQSHAAIVTWNVFCEYWDDFSAPGAQDIAIWPLTEEWLLIYWHEEWLYFGANRE